MKLKYALFTAALALAACGPQSADEAASSRAGDAMELATGHGGQPDSAMLGIHWAKGAKPSSGGSGGTSPDLTWHSGQILNDSTVLAIYWATSWAGYSGDKITGLATFYSGLGGTRYFATNTEYTGTNGQVGNSVSYAGHVVDTSAAPSHAPRTSDINTEVCNALAANGITPVPNGYYPVYTDTPRGHAGYCAWHSYGTCAGVPVQFGFFFDLDGDSGCDPKDTSGLHSQGLAALANVSGHELSECVTDPRNGGWWDSSGNENADKCAWTFNGLETFANGSQWLVQGNWSNAAYDNGQTGYAKGGCINGN